MLYRKDNKSGKELSALGFGCMRFPKSLEKTEALIIKAIEEGINYFDTAYIYGSSEETLGTILSKNKLREKVYIATKLPIVLCKSGKDFDKYFNKELERLKTDYIDYYLIHMLTDTDFWKRLCDWGIEGWIKEKKASGKIRHIGFSFHGIRDEFTKLLDVYDWEFCQIQYNYSDENYQAGVTGLKKAAEKGLPIIIMEPLLGGKLANNLPLEARNIFKEANPSISPAAWAFKWLLDQEEVTVILSGMNEEKQLVENIKTFSSTLPGSLTDEEKAMFKRVKAVFNSSYKVPCTGCNYCMPCPKNVNIPTCFAAYNSCFSIGFATGMQQYVVSSGATSGTSCLASNCIKCRKCEKHCPQNIKISEELVNVQRKLEPFWFKAVYSAARLFLRRK